MSTLRAGCQTSIVTHRPRALQVAARAGVQELVGPLLLHACPAGLDQRPHAQQVGDNLCVSRTAAQSHSQAVQIRLQPGLHAGVDQTQPEGIPCAQPQSSMHTHGKKAFVSTTPPARAPRAHSAKAYLLLAAAEVMLQAVPLLARQLATDTPCWALQRAALAGLADSSPCCRRRRQRSVPAAPGTCWCCCCCCWHGQHISRAEVIQVTHDHCSCRAPELCPNHLQAATRDAGKP